MLQIQQNCAADSLIMRSILKRTGIYVGSRNRFCYNSQYKKATILIDLIVVNAPAERLK